MGAHRDRFIVSVIKGDEERRLECASGLSGHYVATQNYSRPSPGVGPGSSLHIHRSGGG